MGWIRWTYKICGVIHTKHRKRRLAPSSLQVNHSSKSMIDKKTPS